jgi:CspA family cold shock protein
MSQYSGTIKFFDLHKGFGFLSCPSFPEGVFVGAKAALLPPGEYLCDGDEVTFNIDADRDGRQRAANVRVTARASPDERRARPAPAPMERRRRRRDRAPTEQAQIWTHEGNR